MYIGPVLIFSVVMTATFFFAQEWKKNVGEGFTQWIESPLGFKSLESKDFNEDPVQNEIRYFSYSDKDVWMMNQTHLYEKNKSSSGHYNPDRVAIVVRKNVDFSTSSAGFAAEYYQLPSGPLNWSDDLVAKKIKPRVSCTICHANGPRLIRPKVIERDKFSILDEIKLRYWNWLIVSYGLVAKPTEKANEVSQKFEVLKVKTCLQCHNGKSRSYLTQEQSLTIHFLIKNNLMPPLEFKMNSNEKRQLNRFLRGDFN